MQYTKTGNLKIEAFTSPELDDGSSIQFMPDAFSANATLIGVNPLDFPIPFDCKVNGINPIMRGHKFREYVWLQIGIYNPANPSEFMQLKKFGNKYFLDDLKQDQGMISVNYSATIAKEIDVGGGDMRNTILRVNYFKLDGISPVECLFNLMLHQVIPSVSP